MEELEIILGEAYSAAKLDLNLELKKSKLLLYSKENWSKFLEKNNLDKTIEGIYIPKEYSAIVCEQSKFLIPEILHNYFGHGLFIENSRLGRKTLEIQKDAGQEEFKEFFYCKKDENEKNLGISSNNYENYEGFALWIEKFLCLKTRNYNVWKERKDALSKQSQELLKTFENSYYVLTKFGFLAQLGFPAKYSKEKLLEYLRNTYGTGFSKIKLILSSDYIKNESELERKINLIIFSNNPSLETDNGWIKISEFNASEIEEGICSIPLEKRLKIKVALENPHILLGENSYVEKLKELCFSNKTQTF
ncbi:MAG: hypothetical protein ACP5OZ_04095 [Candidatus Woesearchaeota archaeon]